MAQKLAFNGHLSTVTDDEGASGRDSFNVTVLYVPVVIDIKPGNDNNSINPDNEGVIQVAILTDGGFDATKVRDNTCRFGLGQAEPVHYTIKDIDSDADQDMVLHFPTEDTHISFGDIIAVLTGQDTDGRYFIGTDILRTVPSKGKNVPPGKDDAPGQNKEPGEPAEELLNRSLFTYNSELHFYVSSNNVQS